MTSLTQTDPLLSRQVELLFRNLRMGQLISIVNASFLVWVGWGSISGLALLSWWGSAITVAGLRILAGRRYEKTPYETRQADAAQWHRIARTGASFGGLIWAIGAIVMMQGHDLRLELFTAFVMAGMVAGAVPILAADNTAFRLYAWPIITCVAISAIGTDATHIAFTIMAILFMVVSTRSADYFNQTLVDSFRLEHAQASLLVRLKEAHQEAELSNRLKSEFLANISHELRTPMNGILGLSELLELEALTAEQRELLTPLRQSANHLLHLINNLIELSALEAGQITLNPAPFSANELSDALLGDHHRAARTKGLRFTCHVADDLPPILVGDLGRLREVMGHLTANAVKFTQQGSIEIRVEVVNQDETQAVIRFSVCDTGIGMPPAMLRQLKHLMIQADGSSVRSHGGLGVGLPIARKLIELMSGSLLIDSREGEGSTFSFDLPFRLLDRNAL